MWNKGDRVVLRWDDEPRNQKIVDSITVVVEPPKNNTAPQWMTVTDGVDTFMIRGTDCIKG